VALEWDSLILGGNELNTVGPATENARRANSEPTRGTNSNGAPAERIGLAGAATVNVSWRYGGVDVVSTLWVSTAVLYVMRCFTGSQCRDFISGAASICAATALADDADEVVLSPLQLNDGRCWCAVQQGVAVVKSGCHDSISLIFKSDRYSRTPVPTFLSDMTSWALANILVDGHL